MYDLGLCQSNHLNRDLLINNWVWVFSIHTNASSLWSNYLKHRSFNWNFGFSSQSMPTWNSDATIQVSRKKNLEKIVGTSARSGSQCLGSLCLCTKIKTNEEKNAFFLDRWMPGKYIKNTSSGQMSLWHTAPSSLQKKISWGILVERIRVCLVTGTINKVIPIPWSTSTAAKSPVCHSRDVGRS